MHPEQGKHNGKNEWASYPSLARVSYTMQWSERRYHNHYRAEEPSRSSVRSHSRHQIQTSSNPSSSSISILLGVTGTTLAAFCLGLFFPLFLDKTVTSPSISRTSYSPFRIRSVWSFAHFFSAISTSPPRSTFRPFCPGLGPVLSKE
jgi:hypothetical protein